MTIRLIKSDFVPMLHDAGLDNVILLAFVRYIGLDELRMQINQAGDWNLDNDDLIHYIAERGGGLDLRVIGDLSAPTPRPDAPAGLAQNSTGIRFATPKDGTYTIRWYVNAVLIAEEERDCTKAAGRSITKSRLGVVLGDIVQIAVNDSGVIGWWGRAVVE